MANDTKLVSLGSLKKLHDYYLLHFAKEVTPEMFGAVGDGVTDDTQAFRSAIDYLTENGQRTLHLKSKRYFLKDLVIMDSIDIEGVAGTTITGDGGYPCITFDYRSERRIKVTELAGEGFNTVFTLNEDIPADVQRGDILKIYANGSTDLVPNIRYSSHIGEFLTVFDIDRANRKITVCQKLRYPYNPAGGCTYLMLVSKKRAEMRHVDIDVTIEATTNNNVGSITVLAGIGHHFEDITIIEATETVFRMNGCYGYTIENVHAMYQHNTDVYEPDREGVRQLGYSITDNGGGYYKIVNCLSNNIRHFADTGTANTWQQRFAADGKTILAEGGEISGVSEYGLIQGITSQGASGFAIGTHENTYQVTYDNVVCVGNNADGFIARGEQVVLRNAYIEASTNGLYLSNYTDESGATTKCEGNHIFENCIVRAPSQQFAVNVGSSTPIHAIFKNCTFYGSFGFNAPDSHYQFYNCQLFNSDSSQEDGINVEAQGVVLDFYDSEINVRIQPRLIKELNLVNCHVTNTFNMFYGGWTEYVLNCKNTTFEGTPDHTMYLDFTGGNHCNVLFENCTLKRVNMAIDTPGEEPYITDAHKRFKLLNTLYYPASDSAALFYVRSSCNIFAVNTTIMMESYLERWNAGFISIGASRNGFPADKMIVQLELNGVTLTKDYMTFRGIYRGFVVECDNCGTLKGYIRNVMGSEDFTNDVHILENPDKITNKQIVIEGTPKNVCVDQDDHDVKALLDEGGELSPR